MITDFHEDRFINLKSVKEWTKPLKNLKKQLDALDEEKERLQKLHLKTVQRYKKNILNETKKRKDPPKDDLKANPGSKRRKF